MSGSAGLYHRMARFFRGSYTDVALRIRGPLNSEPLAETRLFAVVYGAYGASLLASLVAVARSSPVRGSFPSGVEGIHAWAFPILFMLLVGWTIASTRVEVLSIGVPWINLRSAIPGVTYVFVGNVGAIGFSVAYLGVTLLHATVLMSLLEVYSRPMIPGEAEWARNAERYLEIHLTNWWRVTQLGLSGAVAIGIGVVAQFYLSVQQGASIAFILTFLGPLALGFGSFALYSLWKLEAVEDWFARP